MSNQVQVGDLLTLHTLSGTTVVAGEAGLDRAVRNVSIVAGTEITQWVKPGAALLSTGHPIRERVAALPQIMRELDARSVSCIAVRLGSYMDEFPPEMLELAEDVGLPVIRLTDQFAFDDILIDILGRINSSLLADLELAERVHAALSDVVMSGGSAARVARETARLLSADVELFDPTGVRLQTIPQRDGSPVQWRALEAAARDPRAGTEPTDSLVLRLGSPASSFGYLVGRRTDAPFSSAEVRALERSAAVAALALAQQAAIREVEAHYQGEILARLLRGTPDDVSSAATRFRELGWQLSFPLVVGSVKVWPSPGQRVPDPRAQMWLRSTGLALLRESLDGPSRLGTTGMVGDTLAALVPAGHRDRLAGAFQRVMDAFGRRAAEEMRSGISAGLSSECGELLDVQRALRQADVAARAGRRRPAPARPCSFDGLGALGLVLAASADENGAEVVGHVLAPIDRLPNREAEPLLATLRALVEKDMSLAEAARTLPCHYNTVRHRVRRLEELLGSFTKDADLRLNIVLALRLRDLAG
jgi:purine catabolism regulator